MLPVAFLLFLANTNAALAQALSYGLRGGLNRSTVSSVENPELVLSKAGFSFGAFVLSRLSGPLALQVGATYTKKGFKLTPAPNATAGTDLTAGVSLVYVEIPVLATLVLPTGAPRRIASTIFAGPAIAVEVGCNVETEIVGEAGSRSCDEGGVSTKSVDAGLRVGGGLMFQTRPASFLVEVAYTLGLINIDDFPDSTDEVKNRNLSFSVGIMFPINIGRARDF